MGNCLEKKKISVIMPVYNTEEYLSDAIESVCSQEVCGLELVIVNDGSTDASENVIKEKMSKYNNIVYISQNNMGLSYARKVGLDNSSGEYVYFMDSDDLLLPDSLKKMYEQITSDNLDCLMVNAVFMNELQNEFGYRMDKRKVVSKMSDTEVMTGDKLLETMIKNSEWRYAVWLYFMRKDVLDNITFFKDHIHEDSAFNYQLLSNSAKVKFSDESVYLYRLRENSLMSSAPSLKNILGYINSYLIIYKENESRENYYDKLLFEMRILDQIIEVYNELPDKDKEKAREEFNNIIPFIKKRSNYFVDKYRDFFMTNNNSVSKYDTLSYIDYLEIDIVDHCNLNCSDCVHFSPLAQKKFMDLETFENDLKRLSDLTDAKLKTLVLMGGEPLLHRNLNEFISTSSRYFPNTDIQIVTNGILLDRMSESFWETCKEYNVQINITPYPIGIDYYKLYNKVLNKNIDLFIYDNGQIEGKEFISLCFDKNKEQDAKANYNDCSMAKNCATLKNGKIYICPVINNISRYNDYYNTYYEIDDTDYLDIYKVESDYEIYKFLSEPAEFCKYCDLNNSKKVKWRKLEHGN